MLLQVISLLNKDSHIEDCPNGYALTVFVWHGSNNIHPPTDIKEIAQKRAKGIHQHIQKSNKEIILPGITDLNYPIRFNGKLVTLRQVLINMRSTSDFGCNIFMQVDRQFNKVIIAICHKSDVEKAKWYVKHLCTLTEAFFGKSALH